MQELILGRAPHFPIRVQPWRWGRPVATFKVWLPFAFLSHPSKRWVRLVEELTYFIQAEWWGYTVIYLNTRSSRKDLEIISASYNEVAWVLKEIRARMLDGSYFRTSLYQVPRPQAKPARFALSDQVEIKTFNGAAIVRHHDTLFLAGRNALSLNRRHRWTTQVNHAYLVRRDKTIPLF